MAKLKLEQMLQSVTNAVKNGVVYVSMAAMPFGFFACGGEIDNPQPGLDAGSSADTYVPTQDSGMPGNDTETQNNQPPVPIFKYNFYVGDPWIEAHDGDVITKPLSEYRGYIEVYPCDSYDPDGKITEMWINTIDTIEGEDSFDMLSYGKCTHTGGACAKQETPCNSKVTVRLKDDKGAESKLSVTFKIE